MRKWDSRKLLVALLGLAILTASQSLDLHPAAIAAVGVIVSAYLGGQGWLDGRIYGAGFGGGAGAELYDPHAPLRYDNQGDWSRGSRPLGT